MFSAFIPFFAPSENGNPTTASRPSHQSAVAAVDWTLGIYAARLRLKRSMCWQQLDFCQKSVHYPVVPVSFWDKSHRT